MRISGCGVVHVDGDQRASRWSSLSPHWQRDYRRPAAHIGSVSALISLGLLGAAGRLSIVLAGLAPRLPAAQNWNLQSRIVWPAKAMRADAWLTSLLAAFSSLRPRSVPSSPRWQAPRQLELHRLCRLHRRPAAAACTFGDSRRTLPCVRHAESPRSEQRWACVAVSAPTWPMDRRGNGDDGRSPRSMLGFVVPR